MVRKIFLVITILYMQSNFCKLTDAEYNTNYYAILGLPSTATLDEIRKAYKKLALQWHPDRNPDRIDEATEKSKLINAAHAILANEDTRRDYDLRSPFGNKKNVRPSPAVPMPSPAPQEAKGWFTVYEPVQEIVRTLQTILPALTSRNAKDAYVLMSRIKSDLSQLKLLLQDPDLKPWEQVYDILNNSVLPFFETFVSVYFGAQPPTGSIKTWLESLPQEFTLHFSKFKPLSHELDFEYKRARYMLCIEELTHLINRITSHYKEFISAAQKLDDTYDFDAAQKTIEDEYSDLLFFRSYIMRHLKDLTLRDEGDVGDIFDTIKSIPNPISELVTSLQQIKATALQKITAKKKVKIFSRPFDGAQTAHNLTHLAESLQTLSRPYRHIK